MGKESRFAARSNGCNQQKQRHENEMDHRRGGLAGSGACVLGGEREWVLRTGRTIYLRTIPVDPRDVMRGDYVRVAYEMSSVSRAQCRGRLADRNQAFWALPPDTRVYARLRVRGGRSGGV